jgi:hypothetical protein
MTSLGSDVGDGENRIGGGTNGCDGLMARRVVKEARSMHMVAIRRLSAGLSLSKRGWGQWRQSVLKPGVLPSHSHSLSSLTLTITHLKIWGHDPQPPGLKPRNGMQSVALSAASHACTVVQCSVGRFIFFFFPTETCDFRPP